jgi:cyclohexanecarboxyl-CoA dehydrogenase
LISFEFSEEQQAFRAVLADFARERLLPGYLRRASGAAFPWDVQRELGNLGVLGIGLPSEWGGTGTEDPILLGLAAETLAYGDVNVAAAPVLTGLVAAQLASGASSAVREAYLPPVVAGEAVLAIALTEPDAGSDAAALRTEAVPTSGGWRLRGEKTAITLATVARAALVYARQPGSSRHRGVSCFLVPLDAAGVQVTPMPGMGCLPLGWGSFVMDDVFVPGDHLVGEEGRGFAAAMHHFDFSRAALGLLCLGAAQASLDEAIGFAQEREAFGRKIASYQGISFPLAEHATYLEAARWLCYRALWLRQAGRPHSKLAAMSKWWAPVVAKEAIEAAIKVHGNMGYSVELPLQQRFRDVMAYLVADGTSEIQKRLIATELLGRVAAEL